MAARGRRATTLVERVDAAAVAVEVPVSRVCQEHGCVTVLSQYNATAWCGLHSRRDWRATREPRRRNGTAPVAATAEHDDSDW